MYWRSITDSLLVALSDTPVVFVHGPRQAGKSTLVQGLSEAGHAAPYYTLDDAAVLSAARSDADGFVAGLPTRVILDEVQRAPELFRAIKRSVDARREPGRFLLTGSADALLLPGVSEFLAGRMEVVTLWPLSQGEIDGRGEKVVEGFVDSCFASAFDPGTVPDSAWPRLAERIVRGGFPEVVARTSASRRESWFASYITTVLERDLRDLSNVHQLRELPRLLQLAAARAGSLLNLADLARDAALPLTSLQRYWSLFETTFLARTLPAWSTNRGQRLVKAPKVAFADTGLLCHLLGLDIGSLRSGDRMAGAVLENFVVTELTKQVAWSATRPALFHYRTHTHQEVDVVLERRGGDLVGIEVKKTASPTPADFKGLEYLREATGRRFLRGILLYTGTSSVAFGPQMHAVPVSALWSSRALRVR